MICHLNACVVIGSDITGSIAFTGDAGFTGNGLFALMHKLNERVRSWSAFTVSTLGYFFCCQTWMSVIRSHAISTLRAWILLDHLFVCVTTGLMEMDLFATVTTTSINSMEEVHHN